MRAPIAYKILRDWRILPSKLFFIMIVHVYTQVINIVRELNVEEVFGLLHMFQFAQDDFQ